MGHIIVVNNPNMSSLKVVIIDYVSEKNRGDAAIHNGLINLLQKSFPNAVLSAVSVFGANQFPEMNQEYDQSSVLGIQIYGGLVPTFFPANKKREKPILLFEFQNFLGLIFRLWLLFALKLKIPLRLLKFFISKKYRVTLELIENADLLVIRGRNYRNRKTAALEIFRILSKIFHLLLCSQLSKKMVLIGTSVWDQKSNLADRLLGFAFKACEFVTVRERGSFKVAKKLAITYNFPEPFLLPDLSFAVFNDRKDIILNRMRAFRRPYPKVIGLTIHDWKTQGLKTRDNYLKSISGLVKYYSDLHSRIVIIPQVSINWEDNSELLDELKFTVRTNNIDVIKGNPSVQELLQIYSKLDLLVATRMHSAIFAAAVNTPIIAIAYDKGGKWNIIEELGYKDYLMNYDQVTPELLIKKTVDCWHNKESLVTVAENCVSKNTDNIQLLVNLFESLELKPIKPGVFSRSTD